MRPLPLSGGPARAAHRAPRWEGDATGLQARLHARIFGEVRFDDGSRGLYATDASNYRQVPIGVVVPRTLEDVAETIDACREFGAPVLSRGAGTSLAGQACNVAVVIDFSKYLAEVLEVDPQRRLARVQPGVVLDALTARTKPHGLVFAPDPATHNRCTIGGMIGNNSCGVHSLSGGKTADNVEELDVLLPDGTSATVGRTSDEELASTLRAGGRPAEVLGQLAALRDAYAEEVRAGFPDLPRRVSGYNLDALLPERGFDVAAALVGTEGTCVTVLSATVRLTEDLPHRSLVVVGCADIAAAADAVPAVLEHTPIGLEGLDGSLIDSLRAKHRHPRGLELLPEGDSWLLVELGAAEPGEAQAQARALQRALGADLAAHVISDPDEQEALWAVRKDGLAATAQLPDAPRAWAGWEDSAVTPERLGPYIRQLHELMAAHQVTGSMYGHFGEGCLHVRLTFDLRSPEGTGRFRTFMEEATDLVVAHGGSLSGEHGDGQARGELLERMYGPRLVEAFRRFKAIWDPDGRMNPGKVVDAAPLDADLRLGPDFAPWDPEVTFALPEDGGSLVEASLRCVGVGECRKTERGTMCPSYMVTREELHSTRGRARLLFEMLEGDPVDGGWRDPHVREALDLCLSCKACKTECPVGVDIATYKAEFTHRHFKGRLRPLSAYALGLVPHWARLGARMPRLANMLTRSRGPSRALRRAAGIDPRRTAPPLAHESLASWMRDRPDPRRAPGAPRVLLWLDTFTNFFAPQVGQAAVAVLEDAGYQVEVPARAACCARPLYEFGLLPTARRLLTRTLDVLEPQLEAGLPVVVLEPSCAAAFRDELVGLLPDDPRARRLAAQTMTLAQLLQTAHGYEPPSLHDHVLVQRHCHQAAVIGHDADRALLARTGADVEWLDSGCCGMAGSFGYERDTYEVSVAVGERRLLPAVRDAPAGTVVLADGFSCRTQVADLAGHRAVHLAELLQRGLDRCATDPTGTR